MELIKGGELLDVLSEGGVYEEADAARAMKQAFLGISYLHSQGVVHRDLKLQNMLLTEKDRTSDLKIGDFGLSAQIPKGSLDWGDKEAVKAYHGLSDKWGTPHYFAPEMLWKAYGPQVDIWALGVVLFQLLCGKYPFMGRNNKELFGQIERSPEHLRKQFASSEWDAVSDVAKDLVRKLLNPDPKKRLNADEALAHEWIALRGNVGTGGDLKSAQLLLKQQVAQKRLTALWHLLDIMNALDDTKGSGRGSPRSPIPKLPPGLAKRASLESAVSKGAPPGAFPADRNSGGDRISRGRATSATDRIEELQTLFNLFDTDGNGQIDEHEMLALFKKLGFEPNPEKLRSIMIKVDSNSDGALQFGEFCQFLQLAKQSEFAAGASGGGLGIGSAVEASLNSLTGEDGYITNDNLVHYLRAVAESAGQPLSQSDIDDVLALSDDGNGNTAANIRDAMLLRPGERQKRANERRKEGESSRVASASLSANSGMSKAGSLPSGMVREISDGVVGASAI